MHKNKIFSCFVSVFLLIVLVLPLVGIAQTPGGGDPGPTPGGGDPGPTPGGGDPGPAPTNVNFTLKNPFGQNTTLTGLINKIIDDLLIPIGAVVSVLMIIYAGFLFVTARGNEKQIGDAKQALLYACIGAAILLGAKIISTVIQGTIDQLK